MARRRDRRSGANSSNNQSPQNFLPRRVLPNESNGRKVAKVFLIFCASGMVSAIIYSVVLFWRVDRSLPYADQQRLKMNTERHEIFTGNENRTTNVTARHFDHSILAYVTPWNSLGYDLAKRFVYKFSHLSPVWYELKSHEKNLVLEGRHNVDMRWISDLRAQGSVQVMPRIVLEAFPRELLSKKRLRDKAVSLIVSECKEMGYEGVVLESWSRWAAYGALNDPIMRNSGLQFIKQLGQALHSVRMRKENEFNLQLIYVIGPPYSEKLQAYDFNLNDLRILSDAVDGFSLMTYDFSSPRHPGPNAPLNWIREVLGTLFGSDNHNLAYKVFLGINFYGNDYALERESGGGAITGSEYEALLEQYKPVVQWDGSSHEHYFMYSDEDGRKHVVFYPTSKSLSMRIEEAKSWGTGIAIWEIGQGLDHFFDLM